MVTEKNCINKPSLRFPGFTDPWEQRKVGELVKDHNAGIYISKDNYGEGTNVIGVGNIYDSDIFDGEIYRLGPVDDDKFLLEEGDLIYGESSLVLEGIARTVCVGKNGAGSAFAWHTRRVKLDKTKVDSHFATLELNYHPVVRKYLMSVATQTALTGMTTDGYFSAPLFLPSIQEQRKISAVFKDIDNLITLHQRKCDELKVYKKGLLQQMFPQHGELVPRLRFPGFTGPWEQRKLGELAEIGDIDHRMPPTVDEGIPYLMTGDFCGINELNFEGVKHVSKEDYELLSRKIKPEKGDIVFARYASVGAVRYIDFTRDFLISYSCAIIKKSTKIDSKYLYHYLTGDAAQKQIKIEINSSSQANIGIDSMKNSIAVLVPTSDEQIKISELLSNIDNLITLHQRKCDELKVYKRGLIQNMFV